MDERENLAVPYSLGFAAATIAAAAVFGLGSPRTLMPSQNYDLKKPIEVCKPWEQYSLTNSSISEIDKEIVGQIEIIQNFANRLLGEVVDLDPQIITVVNDNFWDILA